MVSNAATVFSVLRAGTGVTGDDAPSRRSKRSGLPKTPATPTPTPQPGTTPSLRLDVVAALTRLLIDEQRMKRPPEQAAKLLAYIIELHKRDLPFPPRKEVAALLGISVPTIDTALSARLAEGYLTCEVRTIEGNAKNRSSSIKQRYYHPAPSLIEVFDYFYGNGK